VIEPPRRYTGAITRYLSRSNLARPYIDRFTNLALARAYGLKQCRVYKLLHEQGVMRSQSEAVKLEMARRTG
jgi:hypothetical protein